MINYDLMKKKVRTPLGLQDGDDVVDIDSLLNQSYWELLDQFPFREKEVAIAFDTQPDERTYEIPCSFEALRGLSVVIAGQHNNILPLTTDVQEREFNDNDRGTPIYYVREANYIRLVPTPDQAYKIYFRYWTELKDLANDSPANVPRSWHEIVIYGAIWRGFSELGDVNRMNAYVNLQARLINGKVPVESKEEGDRHLAGVEVPIRRDY